jgi:hypothetical protein
MRSPLAHLIAEFRLPVQHLIDVALIEGIGELHAEELWSAHLKDVRCRCDVQNGSEAQPLVSDADVRILVAPTEDQVLEVACREPCAVMEKS